jgi:hypothetical protein
MPMRMVMSTEGQDVLVRVWSYKLPMVGVSRVNAAISLWRLWPCIWHRVAVLMVQQAWWAGGSGSV